MPTHDRRHYHELWPPWQRFARRRDVRHYRDSSRVVEVLLAKLRDLVVVVGFEAARQDLVQIVFKSSLSSISAIVTTMGCRGEDEDDDGGTKEDDEAGAGAGLGGGKSWQSQLRHYFGHFYLVKVKKCQNKSTKLCLPSQVWLG